MKKITRLCRLGTLFILFFGTSLFLWNCDDDISNEEISQEKNIIEYGVSKETLLKSKATKKILSKIQESQRNSNFLNRDTAEELTAEELIDRLDLENTYYSNTDSLEILNAPVKVLGNYKRELFSYSKENNTSSFILTYPNPNDKTVFYITNLNGDLIQKTTIGTDGIGVSEVFNIANTASRSSSDCTGLSEFIYVACSSGIHSFEYGNEGDCDYWSDPDGTPPSSYIKFSGCSGGGNGGNSRTTGGGGPGGVSTAPTGTTGSSPSTAVTTEECVSNLDCEDCNLPADINDDCYVFPYEICLENAGVRSNVFNGLSSINQNAIENFINQNGCSLNTQGFVKLAIEALDNEGIDDGEVDFEDKIINKLTGKARCVYDKLKNSSSGFKNLIKKFDGEFPVSHLQFEEDPTMNSNTKKGYTRPPENYIIDVVLNGNSIKDASYQKRPNLLVAKTIIHEIIHAEMFRKMISLANNNGSIDVGFLNTMLLNGDYPGMLDYFTRFGLNGFQHQQMAQHYRDKIARILQEFDTGAAVSNSQTPQQIYMDLAWEGLIYSNIVVWQQIMDNTERARIENVIDSYILNFQNEQCN